MFGVEFWRGGYLIEFACGVESEESARKWAGNFGYDNDAEVAFISGPGVNRGSASH